VWIVTLVWFGVLACGRSGDGIDKRLVLATIRPYALIAAEIAGARLRVETLLPVSASPHTWSPRPSDVQRISRAGLIIANGLGLEEKLGRFFHDQSARTILAADILGTPGREEKHAEGHEDDGHGHGRNTDPHLWTDPVLMVRFAGVLAKRFGQHDPEGRDLFANNLISFSNRVMALDARIRDEAAGYARRAVVTFHDAFPRLFARYGITRVAALMATPGKEPSAAELAGLGRKIRDAGVRALYREPQMDPRSVNILAKEYGLPVYSVDPIGQDPGVTNYAALIRYNWEMFAKGFAR